MENIRRNAHANRAVLTVGAIKGWVIFCLLCCMNVVVQSFRLCNRIFGLRFKKLDPAFYEDGFSFNICWAALKTIVRDNQRDVSCALNRVGKQAPNINVVSMDKVEKQMLDFQKPGRPLVVNFGSCT